MRFGGCPTRLLGVALALCSMALAQNPRTSPAKDEPEPEREITSLLFGRSGLHLGSLFVSGSYFDMNVPDGVGFNDAVFSGDALIAAGGSAGWFNRGERSRIGVNYLGSYMTYARNRDWAASSHAFSLSAGREVRAKWQLSGGLSARYSTAEQAMFLADSLGSLASLPATFEELANTILTRPFTSTQLASLLTSTAGMDSPAKLALFGNSIFSASANVSASYAKSERLSFQVSANADRMQPVSAGRWGEEQAPRGLLSQSSSAGAGVSVSYNLSPRTTTGVQVGSQRTKSPIQDTYSSSFSAFIGRKMGQRWFAQGSGGGGYIHPLRQVYELPTGLQYQASGSLGFRTYANTILFSAGRSFGDPFGFGAASNVSASLAWTWAHPRRTWSITSSVSEQWFPQRTGTALTIQDLQSISASVGVSKALSPHFSITAGYSYIRASMPFAFAVDREQSTIRVSLSWSPQARGESLAGALSKF